MSYWAAVGSIVLTGGGSSTYAVTSETFLMNVQTGQREQSWCIPNLIVARRLHASMTFGWQCFVACGDGGSKNLSSVEMLRKGAKAWFLDEIPNLTPRLFPVFSQIDAKNIVILGGR